jgi:hypothetical protein
MKRSTKENLTSRDGSQRLFPLLQIEAVKELPQG